MDYYDIDDILLHESRMKVEFKHRIFNFGFTASHPSGAIAENRKVDVPYFLIGFLLRNNHCEVCRDTPNTMLIHDMRANASIVDLRTVCPYFFYLYPVILNDRRSLAEFFYERVGEYSKLLLKETFSEDDVWRLDMTERKLIVESRRSFLLFRSFLITGSSG